MRSVAAWVVLVAGAFAACAPERADFCAKTDMNQVVWQDGFEQALDGYFGEERAGFYWADGLISEQVLTGLGGPPNPLQRLPGGFVLGSACRAHSCPERAAVVIRCPSEPVAVAIKHFGCGRNGDAGSCDSTPMFTIFSAPGVPALAKQQLEQWARTEAQADSVAPVIEYRIPRPSRSGSISRDARD